MDLLTRSILIFNRIDGKFCAKLNKHGRGYGEYIDMTDFYVDNEANSLEIYDLARNRIYVYDLATLDFVTDFAVPLAVRFEKKDGLYYFDTTHMGNYINEEKTNSGVLAYDPRTETVVPLFNDKRSDRENRFFNITGFSTNENGGLFYSQAWDNTFYRIEDQVAEPIMQIDPGKLGIPKSVTEGSYEEQERFFQTNKGGYMLFRLASYTDNRAIVAFTDGTNPHRYMYYMRFGEKEILTDKIVADLLEGEPEINMSNSLVYEDLFLTVWGHDIELSSEAASFLDKQGVTENDNPIITLFKIRKAL